MTSSLEVIRDEHRDIRRTLHALEDLVEDDAVLARGVKSGLIASMLYHLRVFPYAIHHPKEEQHLFPALMAKDAKVVAVVIGLVKEHAKGYPLLREIDVTLAEAGREKGLANLKTAIRTYVGHKLQHMKREEQEILPIAEQLIDVETLASIRREFAASTKAMFSDSVKSGLGALDNRGKKS